VASVINDISTKTVQSPAFGVSAYGHTSVERIAVSAPAGVQVSTCARIRLVGGMGLAAAEDTFPGTSAWRPPTC
jgi:hypothetical protein